MYFNINHHLYLSIMYSTPSPIIESETPAPTPGGTPSRTPGDETSAPETPPKWIDTPASSPASNASSGTFSPKIVFSGEESGYTSSPPRTPTQMMTPELSTPSFEEGLLEDETSDNIYRQATEKDVKFSFANSNNTLYYCNGKVFATMYGAMRESSIQWPEFPVYECSLMPWQMHYTRKCRLPRVSEQMSDFFNRMNSDELFEEMKSHITFNCSKNPFNNTYKTVWINMDDVFSTIVMSNVETLSTILQPKIIVVTQGFDVCNICWSVQSQLKMKLYSDNPQKFWLYFQKILLSRFTTYDGTTSGLRNKFITFQQFCASLKSLLVMATETEKEKRRQRYKRKRELEAINNDSQQETEDEAGGESEGVTEAESEGDVNAVVESVVESVVEPVVEPVVEDQANDGIEMREYLG